MGMTSVNSTQPAVPCLLFYALVQAYCSLTILGVDWNNRIIDMTQNLDSHANQRLQSATTFT